MRVAAIMPCRGRPEQTIANVRRLLSTAGYQDWQLICVGARDDAEWFGALRQMDVQTFCHDAERLTYWQALSWATSRTDAPLLCGLANDLLPGQHWLRRAVEAFDYSFDREGMVGFNGDHHEVGHSCHFLISRSLLERYGGWPVWYDHNYGDTELCQRAIADDLYVKAPWALLYHDHPYFGGRDDATYQEGRARAERDLALFNQRRSRGWPRV
jgi:hypothetical protein